MSNDTISQVLLVVLGIMIFVLFVLIAIFLALKVRENQRNKKTKDILEGNEQITSGKKKIENKLNKENQNISYNKQSIMNFMEFDKIEDNMIVQKKGKRFLMVVQCQGINYDLMSQAEKIGVEEGFQQFLNTLRHPIQIYIQTRSINLERSISTYKTKIKEIEDRYTQTLYKYNQMKESEIYKKEDLDKYFFELTKQRNLLEYGRDLLSNTEKMSLNKSILNKNYYIIIPYFSEDMSDGDYAYDEIKNMAFSELYTKSQSIIRTLSSCSVSGKILSSQELAELLFVAYNREESETFGIEKALKAGYDELYSTAPDVFEKKIKMLDETIQQRAIQLANQTIEKVKSKPQQMAEEKEDKLDELINKMAELVLDENRAYIGEDVAQKAIEELNKTEEGGEETNEEIKEKSTRGRKRKTVK